MKKIIPAFLTLLGMLFFVKSFAAPTDNYQAPRFNMHYGVTQLSHDMYYLHMTIFWICVVIGVIVFGALLYSLIKHRKSLGVKPAQFHENTKLEIAWAIVPFLILIAMAVPATIVLVRMNNSAESALTIKITGYQWKWQYDYLDQGISFYSNLKTPPDEIYGKKPKSQWYLLDVDRPIVVPINQKIRFLTTANDVIHSWWVPALGIKRDAIPGFINEAWAIIYKTGIYRGQCAELCGVYHGFMPIVVHAVTPEEFKLWVERERGEQTATKTAVDKTFTAEELMKLGQSTYDKYCSACHQPNGMGISPVYPALKGSSVSIGKPISRHIDIVLKGIPGSAMQAFGGQLTDAEIAAVVTYERNAWENNTGDLVQPIDIKEERKKATTANPSPDTKK